MRAGQKCWCVGYYRIDIGITQDKFQYQGVEICIINNTQFVLICTGLNSALCCKSRAGNTEIGNKKDYISCCDSKFHAILRSLDNI